jgi:biopolymer transport protein ExbD
MIDFGEHRPQKKTLDMTPMIDVVFLLLIFFLLTSIFSKPSIPLNLPEAETAAKRSETTASIAVKKDGTLAFNGEIMAPNDLYAKLARLMESRHYRSVAIESDRGVPFGTVVEVMDQARKAGAKDIAVIAEQKR